MSNDRDTIRIWIAQDADEEQCKALLEEIRKAIADPTYSIITNFHVEWCDVTKGAVIWAEDANSERIEQIRTEIEAAWEDRDYIVVFQFHIDCKDFPRPLEPTSELPA